MYASVVSMVKGVLSQSSSSLNTISEEEVVCSPVCVCVCGEVGACATVVSMVKGVLSQSRSSLKTINEEGVCSPVGVCVCVWGGAFVFVFTSMYVCVAVVFHDNVCESGWGSARVCVWYVGSGGGEMCACA